MRWLAVDETSVPAGSAWLSDREREVSERQRLTKRRQEWLLRRYAMKRAAAVALGRGAAIGGLEALNDPSGAPYILLDGCPVPIAVSVSDRAGLAVALVTSERHGAAGSIGIDVELVESRSDGFIRDFLTAPEQLWTLRTTLGRDVAANLLWSAKEAALKVLRVGLRADTRTVDVTVRGETPADGWRPLSVAGAGGVVLPGWWRRDGDFLITVVTRDAADPPTRMPGGVDPAHVTAAHSWLDNPLA